MYAIPRAGADAPKCDANTGGLASFLTHVVLSSEGIFRSNLSDWTEAIPSHGCGAGWRARARGLPSQRAAETAPGELPSHTNLSWFWSFQASGQSLHLCSRGSCRLLWPRARAGRAEGRTTTVFKLIVALLCPEVLRRYIEILDPGQSLVRVCV